MGLRALSVCVFCLGGLPLIAAADVILTSQERSITAATTSNGNSQTLTAMDFAPFVQNVAVSNTFTGPTGPVVNTATSRIDCQISPLAVVANGSLGGAGGLQVATGTNEFGDARASILIGFLVSVPTPFRLIAAPRPDVNPDDDFRLELTNLALPDALFRLDETDPAQAVDFSGVLQPGEYRVRFRAQVRGRGPSVARDYSFNLAVPSPGAAAAIAIPGFWCAARRRRESPVRQRISQ